MRIQPVTLDTLDLVLPLIAQYQRFYDVTPDEERNRAFFARVVTHPSVGAQFLAVEENGSPLGFATLYFPLSSVSARVVCLMNDLYVVPEARGKGVGRALIEWCREHAREHGYPAMEWQTARSNETAQLLYESMGAARTEWYTYTLRTEMKE